MNRISNLTFLSLIILLGACGTNKTTDSKTSVKDSVKQTTLVVNTVSTWADDSIKLTKLTRDLYQWHQKPMKHDGFKALKSKPTDTLSNSIDLEENTEAIKELKATGFFADEFLDNYRNLAVRMDKELREGTSLWPDGEVPTFFSDADEWCNCQDNPDNYWETLTLTDLKFDKDQATFKWTWGDNFFYKVHTRKEGDNWKISYLEGWDPDNFNWEWVKKHPK